MASPCAWGPDWGPGMLSDAACKNAKPEGRDRKLSDSGGLYLLVRPAGTKAWYWKYRFEGREKKLSLGHYPAVGLAQARKARDAARDQLRVGEDPAAARAAAKIAALTPAVDTFEQVARDWHRARSVEWDPRYAAAVLSRLENNLFPRIGRKRVGEIDAPTMLAAIRAIEARGARDMARRVRQHASEIFRRAMSSGLASIDPADVIAGALTPRTARLRPAALTIEEARAVLARTENAEGAWWATLLASRLLALTAARPGVVRLAERKEFEGLDGAEPLWRIPAAKMKLSTARKRDRAWSFVVPLSRQPVAVVNAALAASPSPRWLFPGIQGWRKPISDSTLSKLYREVLGAGGHVPHGWRATFSTVMNERAGHAGRDGDRAVIDLMLAHVKGDVEAAYNRAAYMPRRRELAQDWADLLMEGAPPPDTLTAHLA